MKYFDAQHKDVNKVFHIVQETIKTVYPKYYPKEVVDFFCKHHNEENIQKDILDSRVGILTVDDEIVGTGCYQGNHITRVYVLPECQGKGYGTFIINELEKKISERYNCAELDASLPACHLYEKLGFRTREHCRYIVDNGVVLVYEIMEKAF